MMKTCLIIFSLCTLTICINAQKIDASESAVFISPIQIQPKWILGTNEQMVQEITAQLEYPADLCIHGMTILQFTIDTFGQVANPLIRRSISKHIDEQLLSIICNYEFQPGFYWDRKVEVQMNLPIRIRME